MGLQDPPLRQIIDDHIQAGAVDRAVRQLRRLWRAEAGLASAGFVVSRFEQMRRCTPLVRCKLAVLRSFTLEPLAPLVRAGAFVGGIDLDVRLGGFNAYVPDALGEPNWLYDFSPDVVLLAVQTRDIAPQLWDRFADLNREEVNASVDQTLATFKQAVEALRARSSAHLIIHSLQLPSRPAQGILDQCADPSQAAAIDRINTGLRQLAREFRNVYLLDYNGLIARFGADAWQDERKWRLARMPIAAGQLIHLADEWLRYLHPLTGRICKVLAIDLDNTLWGGVIGEDGLDGIKLGDEHPGAPYLALQRAILDLHRRGVILAICSKNNPTEAMEAIEKHPGMLLRQAHFGAVRLNWGDKADNLREIAKELNVGLDAVAFLDDSAVEREWVAEQAPVVTVIDLPADPYDFAEALRAAPVFERLNLTDEDKSRGQFYAEQRFRGELKQKALSIEDFYRSLRMAIRIEPVTPQSLARSAQLSQKTNQFNLTTRRYSEAQLAELIASSAWRGCTASVADRFGDNGIVGLAIMNVAGELAEIDTFLLSCRVIGRTIETAFLASLAQEAMGLGAKQLTGWFVPTSKNGPAADFYSRHGFVKSQEIAGATRWTLDLPDARLNCPPWIDRQVIQR